MRGKAIFPGSESLFRWLSNKLSLVSQFEAVVENCRKEASQHQNERDKAIAEHVVKLHRYRAPGEEDGAILEIGTAIESLTTLDLEEKAPENTSIWENNNEWTANTPEQKIVTMNFMKKFITFAKQVKPTLSTAASTYIGEKYADLREFDESKEDRERTSVVTARTLETLIRLATAHAKIRLSKSVEKKDAEAAFSLLHFALFKEKPKERIELEEEKERKRRRVDEGDDEGEDDEDYTTRTTKTRGRQEDGETEEGDDVPASKRARTEDDLEDSAPTGGESESLEVSVISVDRYQVFRRHLRAFFDDKRAEQAPLKEIVAGIQKKMSGNKFTKSEIDAAVERLEDENAAMLTEGDLVLI